MQASISVQKAFGSFLAELRQRAGLHIDQLAEKSGLSGTRLSAIERGNVNLNLGTMLLLAMSLDISPQDLFSGIATRINGSPSSHCDASKRNEFLSVQAKLQLWIGSVNVRPLVGCEELGYSQGAFVNIVTWATDTYEYERKITKALGELRLFAIEIYNPEPIEKTRARDGEFDDPIQDAINKAENNPESTICALFHIYEKADC